MYGLADYIDIDQPSEGNQTEYKTCNTTKSQNSFDDQSNNIRYREYRPNISTSADFFFSPLW